MESKAVNPWTTLSSTPVYDNPWISVSHKKVLTPAGNDGIYGLVSFKNLAIGIIPLDEEMNTWLIGQYRYPLEEYSWEIPMGGGKIGSPALESAQRELKEETGLTAQTWTYLMKLHPSNSVTDETGHVFLAEGLSQGETAFEETEILEIRKLPLSEAVAMAFRGDITDAISVAGLFKAALLKGIEIKA